MIKKITFLWEENKENFVSAIVGIVGLIAIIINTNNKGWTEENLLDAIKDIAGLAVAIIIVFVAVAARNKLNNPYEIGKLAVKEFESKYKEEVELRYNSKAKSQKKEEVEENESNEDGNKYLFIKKTPAARKFPGKVTFIPVNELKDGILDIRVSASTLANKGKEGTKEEIVEMREKVRIYVMKIIENHKLLVEKDYIIEEKYNNNSGITIDFEEGNIKGKKYKKIIFDCLEAAYLTIKQS